MPRETYIFKIGPDYQSANYFTRYDRVSMPEWDDRPITEFADGMKNRGFQYRCEEYELPGGRKITEHIWER